MSDWIIACGVALATCVVGDRPPHETFHPNGAKKTSCQWIEVDGRWVRDGEYHRWSEAGEVVVSGKYQRGLRFGTWRFRHPNGQIHALGSYQIQRTPEHTGSYRVRRWEVYGEHGGVDEGRTGDYRFAKERYPGEPAMGFGSYLNGQRHAQWTFLWSNGRPMLSGWYEWGRPTGN